LPDWARQHLDTEDIVQDTLMVDQAAAGVYPQLSVRFAHVSRHSAIDCVMPCDVP
jgi:hypothetical protein